MSWLRWAMGATAASALVSTGAGLALGWRGWPSILVIWVVFLARRQGVVPLISTALWLGHLEGRQALAPVGQFETASVLMAATVYVLADRFATESGWVFASAAAVVTAAHGLLLWALGGTGRIPFDSHFVTGQVTEVAFTAGIAIVLYPLLVRLWPRATGAVTLGAR